MTTLEQAKKDWKKPDNPRWNKIGNAAIFIAQPLGILAILIFVPTEYKDASVAAWVAIITALKAGTKLTTKN